LQIIRPARETEIALRFEVVPAYELPIGLAAAAQPERHELSDTWSRTVRRALPSEVRRDLAFFFGDPSALGVAPIRLVPDLEDGQPEHLVKRLEELDTADLIALLLSRGTADRRLSSSLRRTVRGRASAEDENVVRQHLASLRAETRRRTRAILAEPAAMRDRYLRLVRAAHDSWFAQHVPDVLPLLNQRAKQARRSIGKLPAKEIISRVTGGFTLQSHAARAVTLVPSYYASPFVYVVREGRDAVLVYGARPVKAETSETPIDAGSVRVLKALADETRLRILQLLARKPMYGQQLAEALGVSHPTISHHMAQLRIAGLTQTELDEEGNKTYFVQREALESLFAVLRDAFMEPEGRTIALGRD
jgi:DNA-binding transcriptional ArsR family regulator